MRGGHFDYYQYHIREIAESIQEELDQQGQAIPKSSLRYGYSDQEQLFYETYGTHVSLISLTDGGESLPQYSWPEQRAPYTRGRARCPTPSQSSTTAPARR